MDILKELSQQGTSLGLTGKDLVAFIKDQQEIVREERAKEREQTKTLKEYEVQKLREENKDKELDVQLQLKKMDIDNQVKLKQMELDAAVLLPQPVHVKQDNGNGAKSKRTKLQTQRAPLPKFKGNLIEYYPFKWDFEFLFNDYTEPDEQLEALYILKECLEENGPRQWVVGETQLDEAWITLDAKYGDPVQVSAAIVNHIHNFSTLLEHDPRISELYLFLKKAKLILTKLKKTNDIDNSTMLGFVENKLHVSDRLRWAECQRTGKIESNLDNFVTFLGDQVWIYERANDSSSTSKNLKVKSSVHATYEEDFTDNGAIVSYDESSSPSSSPSVHVAQMSTNSHKSFSSNDHKASAQPQNPCWLCKNPHKVHECERFLRLTPNERLAKVRENRICFFCLKSHRFTVPCYAKKKCTKKDSDNKDCTYSHHELLHGANFAKNQTGATCAKVGSEFLNGCKLLPICTVMASNGDKYGKRKWKKTNVLLDAGSEITLITHRLAQSLNLTGEATQIIICPVGTEEYEYNTMRYEFCIKGLDSNSKTYKIKAIALPKLSKDIEYIDLSPHVKKLKINTEIHREPGPVDILVGIDNIDFHTGEIRKHEGFGCRMSNIGQVIFGLVGSEPGHTHKIELQQSNNSHQVAAITVEEPPDLTEFWTTETLGVALNICCTQPKQMGEKILTAKENLKVKEMRQTAKKIENRWMFQLPYERDPCEFPNNEKQAYGHLVRTENRLLNDTEHPENIGHYKTEMRELEEVESSRKCSKEELLAWLGAVIFITHNPVYNFDKPLHPCRMVWNAGLVYKGCSLNMFLCKCGDLLLLLIGVKIRWREFEIVYYGDVFRMYHQILTTPPIDHHTHRYLYREFDQSREPDVYVKQVVTFGDISSPAIANLAMEMTAEEFLDKYPASAKVILENRYMDDITDSVPRSVNLPTRLSELDEILDSGHFRIKEWITNDNPDLLSENPMKVLGTMWYPKTDEIGISIKKPKTLKHELTELTNVNFPLTKRIALSAMGSAFDNFGMGAPVIIRGKILMQKTWLEKQLDWDDIIPDPIRKQWCEWFSDLLELKELRFPRCLTPPGAVGNPSLVTFCDSSRQAFGGVCYIRWMLENGRFDTRFILAKSRVTPTRELTLPKLELQSAIVATRLAHTILKESRFNFENIYHFTDSMITLHWIRNESKLFMPFVATRVGEIQTKTCRENWHHIPTQENVCDEITRGLKTSQIKQRFENGPEFLTCPVEEWPVSPFNDAKAKTLPEFRVHTCAVVPAKIHHLADIQPLPKLIRVVAWMLRFIKNCRINSKGRKTRSASKELLTGHLSVSELNKAETCLIKIAQTEIPETFPSDYKTLSPFVDAENIIRVGGRRGNAEVSYDQRHPVLLPYGHYFSRLIVLECHKYGHPGVNTTTAKVRRKYWVINLQRLVKSILFNCVFCREIRGTVNEQLMANLPVPRVNPAPPFYHSSCDLYGPYNVKLTRNGRTKYWGVLFTCLSTRAVYADVTSGYSSPEFIETLRRFITIRAMPSTCLSDRGSQLIASAKEIVQWCSSRKIKWDFVCAKAAHMNGVTESLVKSIKNAMNHAVKDTALRPLELQTVMFEAANLVNERPIGATSNDVNDGNYLSPNDILLGRSSGTIPHGPFAENPTTRDRVAFCQEIVNAFWQKWYRDVFPTLTLVKKWHTATRNLKVDDLVLICESSPLRSSWVKGRIVKTFPGPDSKVRSVRCRTATGEVERPINKLICLLPVEEQT